MAGNSDDNLVNNGAGFPFNLNSLNNTRNSSMMDTPVSESLIRSYELDKFHFSKLNDLD